MKNEKEFKKLVKQSIRRFKGVYIALAAPMVVGIPDAYVSLSGYIPVLLEMKWLGEIKRDKFSRQVPFTEMQMLQIKECHDVNPYSAMGLLGFIYQDQIHACLVAYGTPLFYQFTSQFVTDCSFSIYSTRTKVFDIPDMFDRVPIPRIKLATRLVHDTSGSQIVLAT